MKANCFWIVFALVVVALCAVVYVWQFTVLEKRVDALESIKEPTPIYERVVRPLAGAYFIYAKEVHMPGLGGEESE